MVLSGVVWLMCGLTFGNDPDVHQSLPKISAARLDDNGFLIHAVESAYQPGTTEIKVLLPNRMEKNERYPVVYVLPVEAGNESRYGNGLLEIKRHELHNKHQAIFVAPTFSQLPWYADHPSNPLIRQETYFLKVVVPAIEKHYAAKPDRRHRFLMGFSKSGWGAWSLLLRHPDVFGKAAAWDAPLMMDRLGKYGSSEIFGAQENFERYRVADLLKEYARAKEFRDEKRLILTGFGNFREEHKQVHQLMSDLQIAHEYEDGPQRKHDWHSGWVPQAVGLLLK